MSKGRNGLSSIGLTAHLGIDSAPIRRDLFQLISLTLCLNPYFLIISFNYHVLFFYPLGDVTYLTFIHTRKSFSSIFCHLKLYDVNSLSVMEAKGTWKQNPEANICVQERWEWGVEKAPLWETSKFVPFT